MTDNAAQREPGETQAMSMPLPPDVDEEEAERLTALLQTVLGNRFIPANSLTLLRNGAQIFPAMLEAIARARSRIDLLTYVYWRGDIARRFADALCERARAGVTVRVLLDAFGAWPMDRALIRQLREAGAEVRWFRPLGWRVWQLNHRTHRKVLVCDADVGFTGGVGIARQWEGDARDPSEWRDTHVEVRGPAVAPIRAAFLNNWNACGAGFETEIDETLQGRVDPGPQGNVPLMVVKSTACPGWTDMATLLRILVLGARHRLAVLTPYFVPDPILIRVLCEAAERGVDVRVVFPTRHNDSRVSLWAGRQVLGELLQRGVRIFQYTATLLHVKQVVVDDIVTAIGSPNWNHRSMGRDEEVCLVAMSRTVAEKAMQHFEEDVARSVELEFSDWNARGVLPRLQERCAALCRGSV